MIWPPRIAFVIPVPVAVLDDRQKGNRSTRRLSRFGRQNMWEKLEGKLSPKQLREWK